MANSPSRGPIPKGSIFGIRFVTKDLALRVPDLQQLYKTSAQRLQASVLEAFDVAISEGGREQRRPSYLRDALASDEAIVYNASGFVYLREGYLEGSPARTYWRNLEEGTTKFVDRVLQGYFESSSGERSQLGERRTDMRFYGRMEIGGRYGGVVKNPIEPRHYIARGIAEWQANGGTQPILDALKTIAIVKS